MEVAWSLDGVGREEAQKGKVVQQSGLGKIKDGIRVFCFPSLGAALPIHLAKDPTQGFRTRPGRISQPSTGLSLRLQPPLWNACVCRHACFCACVYTYAHIGPCLCVCSSECALVDVHVWVFVHVKMGVLCSCLSVCTCVCIPHG